jgi:hypothetical protein
LTGGCVVSVERYEPSRRMQRRIAERVTEERFEQAVQADWLRHRNQMAHQAVTYDVALIDRITQILKEDDNPLKREALLRRFVHWQTGSEGMINRSDF